MFKGWVRTSLIDYPGRIATVLFSGGCNLRCPFCHNPDLVLRPGTLAPLSMDKVWSHLEHRQGLIDGLVVSGGEPCLYPQALRETLTRAKSLGLQVKLDTNGFFPDVVEDLLAEGLLDFVAMDIKAPPDKYSQLCGLEEVDLEAVRRTVRLLMEGELPYEFRTTVVPGLLTLSDLKTIAFWLNGAEVVALQQFRPEGTLDPGLARARPYPPEWFHQARRVLNPYFGQVKLRGLG